MAQKFFSHIMHKRLSIGGNDITQLHVVFDKYNEDSIKNMTLEKCGQMDGHSYHVLPDVAIPQNWKQFLGKNKTALAEYYTKYMTEKAPALLRQGEGLYVSGGKEDTATRITPDSVSDVASYHSSK
jgi:hypothetical protein